MEIVGLQPTARSTVTGVEMFKKLLNEGQAGDNVGLLLRGVKREDVLRGQVVCKPGSITPHTTFEGEVYCLSKEEGGRHTPFTNNYRPQFFFRTADVTGAGVGGVFCLFLLIMPRTHTNSKQHKQQNQTTKNTKKPQKRLGQAAGRDADGNAGRQLHGHL